MNESRRHHDRIKQQVSLKCTTVQLSERVYCRKTVVCKNAAKNDAHVRTQKCHSFVCSSRRAIDLLNIDHDSYAALEKSP
mmetsp:Transcript_21258/g.38626  ORF Transcript_21258/g.38626 Transcript_21258/m.38626 type:complete len:80 (-) Transcript_21258:465-704(-)